MADAVRPTRISLDEGAREEAIDCLNENLANTLFGVLAAKYAHWNVKGTGFLPTHRFFDEIYDFYSKAADTIGERITALGGTAEGLLHYVATGSTVNYSATADDNVDEHTTAMADLLGQISNGYREGIEVVRVAAVNDQLTQDVFIELGREADKLLYFLEASQRKS
jgi:starvation-inducible DNA-binding protein